MIAEKKQRGRPWQPGQSGNPNGRPTKAKELAILDAINSSFSPEQYAEYLAKAIDIAIEQKSTRGMVAVLEFVADRLLGKPTQRIENSSAPSPADWHEAFRDDKAVDSE